MTGPISSESTDRVPAMLHDLARMPEPEPAPELWQRVVQGTQRRHRLRQASQLLGLTCALGLAGWWSGVGLSPELESAGLRAAQESPTGSAHADALQAVQVALRGVDRQLQDAYARGDRAAVRSLWARREALSQHLNRTSSDAEHAVLSL